MDSWELLRYLAEAPPDDPRWRVFFKRCESVIRATLRSRFRGRRPEDTGLVDDLAQDVMVRLVSDRRRVLSRFAGTREETFAVYIRKIAENIRLDQLRRDAYRREVEESFPPEELWRLEAARAESTAETAGDHPEAALRKREMDESVAQVLQRISLDDRQRALNRLLFRLYFEDRYSIAQIARLHAVPLSTSSVARRIALIRTELGMAWTARRHRAAPRRRARLPQRKRTARKPT